VYVTRHLDWLSFSVGPSVDFRHIFPTIPLTYSGEGVHGYRAKYYNLATGLVVYTDAADTAMGSAFTLSGDVLCEFRRQLGSDDTALSQQVVRAGGKASRTDLTINIHEGELTPRHVQQAIKSGKAKARANVSRFIEGQNGDISGDTYYIGSPKSDRQFRAYNKSAELGIGNGSAWLRLELELRRSRAYNALNSVAVNGVNAAVSGHMGDFVQWGNMEYRQAIAGPSVCPVDIPRKQSNRRRWLLGQVAQALAKEVLLDPDFRDMFNLSVNYSLDELKSRE